MESQKILITDACHRELYTGLEQAGWAVDYMPGIGLDEIERILSLYTGIIVNTRVKMDKHRMDLGGRLKFIGRLGSGLDIFDLDYAQIKGIKIISVPEGNANAVGEHTLAMLLSLLNKLPTGHNMVRTHQWDREAARGRELNGLTVGVVGYGHNGSAFVRNLSGFKVRVLVYDKYKEIAPTKINNLTVEPVYIDTLIASSDIISFHIPLTGETANMVNHSFLTRCKLGAVIVNTSRGGIVDLYQLWAHLQSGHLSGFCLDVFPNEKPETFEAEYMELMDALAASVDVILTPHVAGWTNESFFRIGKFLAEKINSEFKII